jgi:hypothetical protein
LCLQAGGGDHEQNDGGFHAPHCRSGTEPRGSGGRGDLTQR